MNQIIKNFVLDSRSTSDYLTFVRILLNKDIKIRCGNILEIDFKIIFGLYATLASYTIVTLQMKV